MYAELECAATQLAAGAVDDALATLRAVCGAVLTLDEAMLRSKLITRHIASVLLNGCCEMLKLWARVAAAAGDSLSLPAALAAYDTACALSALATRIGVKETCVTACAALAGAIIVALGDARPAVVTDEMRAAAHAITFHMAELVSAKQTLAAVASTMPSHNPALRSASGGMYARLTEDGVVDADATVPADLIISGSFEAPPQQAAPRSKPAYRTAASTTTGSTTTTTTTTTTQVAPPDALPDDVLGPLPFFDDIIKVAAAKRDRSNDGVQGYRVVAVRQAGHSAPTTHAAVAPRVWHFDNDLTISGDRPAADDDLLASLSPHTASPARDADDLDVNAPAPPPPPADVWLPDLFVNAPCETGASDEDLSAWIAEAHVKAEKVSN